MALYDNFSRRITYLRLSVTDRCDFRCVYCMAEDMTFLPRAQVLTLEELAFIGETFIELGVEKIRITGGEPLIRRNILSLFQQLNACKGLRELTLTTNASQLQEYAQPLYQAGLSRINISLDSLQPARFRTLTRHGELSKVLAGIDAARDAGFKRIKINSVILKNRNADEVIDLVQFALHKGLDISFIEEMPLGNIDEHNRREEFVSSLELRQQIAGHFQLSPAGKHDERGGPSRYWQVQGYDSHIGFISPHSENFCSSCNRVRLSADGRLLLCLGNEHSADLKAIVRAHPGDKEKLKDAIITAMAQKPERHHFDLNEQPQILRFMNATGG